MSEKILKLVIDGKTIESSKFTMKVYREMAKKFESVDSNTQNEMALGMKISGMAEEAVEFMFNGVDLDDIDPSDYMEMTSLVFSWFMEAMSKLTTTFTQNPGNAAPPLKKVK